MNGPSRDAGAERLDVAFMDLVRTATAECNAFIWDFLWKDQALQFQSRQHADLVRVFFGGFIARCSPDEIGQFKPFVDAMSEELWTPSIEFHPQMGSRPK